MAHVTSFLQAAIELKGFLLLAPRAPRLWLASCISHSETGIALCVLHSTFSVPERLTIFCLMRALSPQAYKYIPYGKVGETIPYLLRRAQENSGMLGGASHERGLLLKEMRRRASSPLSRSWRAPAGGRGFSSSARDRLSFSSKLSLPSSSPNSKTRTSFSCAAVLLAWPLVSIIKGNDGDSGYRVADSARDRLVGGGTEQNASPPKLRRYEHTKRNERCQ